MKHMGVDTCRADLFTETTRHTGPAFTTHARGHRLGKGVTQGTQEAGGKILAAYALLGRFDYIYITEFPDQKSAMKSLTEGVK